MNDYEDDELMRMKMTNEDETMVNDEKDEDDTDACQIRKFYSKFYF